MFGNFSLFKTPFQGRDSLPGTELRPSLFCLFFGLLYFFLPPFEDLGCFSGCLMSSVGLQKLFCGIYSAFKCSFDEFVGEKVFSPSYSSAILVPPLLEKTLESPLDCKEIQPVHSKGDQSWVFFGRSDAKAETHETLVTSCEELTHWKRL